MTLQFMVPFAYISFQEIIASIMRDLVVLYCTILYVAYKMSSDLAWVMLDLLVNTSLEGELNAICDPYSVIDRPLIFWAGFRRTTFFSE
jgi:hypothetical protein